MSTIIWWWYLIIICSAKVNSQPTMEIYARYITAAYWLMPGYVSPNFTRLKLKYISLARSICQYMFVKWRQKWAKIHIYLSVLFDISHGVFEYYFILLIRWIYYQCWLFRNFPIPQSHFGQLLPQNIFIHHISIDLLGRYYISTLHYSNSFHGQVPATHAHCNEDMVYFRMRLSWYNMRKPCNNFPLIGILSDYERLRYAKI